MKDFVLAAAGMDAASLIKLLLILALVALTTTVYLVGRYVHREIKQLKVQLLVLKKDVEACHGERRKLQLLNDQKDQRIEQQNRRISDGLVRENLLSELVREMKTAANGND